MPVKKIQKSLDKNDKMRYYIYNKGGERND